MAALSTTELIATITALHTEVAELRRRVGLLEAFVDVRHRQRAGLTTDMIREAWHGKPPVPERGAV